MKGAKLRRRFGRALHRARRKLGKRTVVWSDRLGQRTQRTHRIRLRWEAVVTFG